jgi:hypothetical protein
MTMGEESTPNQASGAEDGERGRWPKLASERCGIATNVFWLVG